MFFFYLGRLGFPKSWGDWVFWAFLASFLRRIVQLGRASRRVLIGELGGGPAAAYGPPGWRDSLARARGQW
jgi:hypothetical protein